MGDNGSATNILPTDASSLKSFIANALTEDITCYGGDDDDQVKKVAITTSQTQAIMLNLIIGVCVTLTVLVFSDKIKSLIIWKYGAGSLPTGVAYLSIIFIIMCFMDLIFGGVNSNNYFMIWGFVMLMIPLSLIAKYSFGNELTESIDFTQFGEMIKLSLEFDNFFLNYFAFLVFLICFPIAIGVGTASSLEYSVQFPVFLTFSLLFFATTIWGFIYKKGLFGS
jgi:hypothetical protein